MKLLLHACCAPCTVSCSAALRAENIEPCLFWYNPNIHLSAEYRSRRDCLKSFAAEENLELSLIDEYGLRSFLKELGNDGLNRCEKCYRMRLEKTAAFSAENNFSAFSTTLLISPYQDHDELKRIGEETAEKYGVDFLYRDFRPLFREGQSVARNKGLYMQKYCGCIFSEEERYLKTES
jgi:predicted adenine nucleotide alpha hydrolase (AANH) superfamily ATPase